MTRPILSSRSLPAALSPQLLHDGIRSACAGLPITLVYLFGSHARGSADAESDVDVAVLARPDLSKTARHELRLRLFHLLAEALSVSSDRIDVVILQDVPVLLRYNVIRGGTPVLERNPSARATFEYETERDYEDERPMLEMETELTLARLASRAR